MRYLLLIYGDEATATQPGTPGWDGEMTAYQAFGEAVNKAGVMRAGDALQPTSTATTVRVRDGKTLTTDGPFAETKEQLGGYYLVECKDIDEALGWAARIPGALNGSIEVRPIMEF